MSYLYCLEVHLDTKDDVNTILREAKLKGEITMTAEGKIFLCPQLSNRMWTMYPQSKELPTVVDEQWNKAIADCIALFEKNYKISYSKDKIGWKQIAVYRCSKMEHFIREYDISH